VQKIRTLADIYDFILILKQEERTDGRAP